MGGPRRRAPRHSGASFGADGGCPRPQFASGRRARYPPPSRGASGARISSSRPSPARWHAPSSRRLQSRRARDSRRCSGLGGRWRRPSPRDNGLLLLGHGDAELLLGIDDWSRSAADASMSRWARRCVVWARVGVHGAVCGGAQPGCLTAISVSILCIRFGDLSRRRRTWWRATRRVMPGARRLVGVACMLMTRWKALATMAS